MQLNALLTNAKLTAAIKSNSRCLKQSLKEKPSELQCPSDCTDRKVTFLVVTSCLLVSGQLEISSYYLRFRTLLTLQTQRRLPAYRRGEFSGPGSKVDGLFLLHDVKRARKSSWWMLSDASDTAACSPQPRLRCSPPRHRSASVRL